MKILNRAPGLTGKPYGNIIKVQAISDDRAQMMVYGFINNDEVKALDFVTDIKSLAQQFPNIDVRINSGGGNVFDGIAMYHAMRDCGANVETYIDGLAGSMATIIALGGATVHMNKYGKMMTHKPKGEAQGTSEEMSQYAALLATIENDMAEIYANKTGKTKLEAATTFITNSDRWWNADEALGIGLVNRLFDSAPVKRPASPTTEKAAYEQYAMQLAGQTDVLSLAMMSWGELDRAGKLEALKAGDLNLFKKKYRDEFGKDWDR